MKRYPRMFGLIIFFWLCAVFYFTPRILALLIGPENIFAKLAIITFALLLNLFWFYAFYHLIIILFSYFVKPYIQFKNSNPLQKERSVALLYTTFNDFREEAVLSCLAQDYPNFHTFILNDSTDKECLGKIDRFAATHPNKVTVLRRNDKKGYKAGNINHALNNISGFDYFSISDADTILPKDYIKKLLPYFNDPKVAFVQARQVLNSNQKSSFAQGLGFQIGLHCDHYLSTKNRYGFVMFYGHGALMRLDVLREIGGFPEVATEDLAYSMKVREKDYFGVYAPEVVCYEDYPPTYQQYRKRSEKWIRGTAECLLKFYPSFLKNRQISWVEKFDVASSAGSLLLGLPFLLLLILVGIILPFYFYHFRFQGPMFKMPLVYNNSFIGATVGISGNLFWKWDFFIMLILTIIAPILPAIVEAFRNPIKRLRYISMYTFIFYAMQVNSSVALIAYLISRKASFPVTGDKSESIVNKISFRGLKDFLQNCLANHKAVILIEGIFAILFLIISLATRNIWFLIFALGTAIGIFIFKFNFENRILKFLAVIPLIILVIIVLFIGKTLQ